MDLDALPSTATHPNPQPNPHHRKVDLQSSHDLTYLQTNLAQSALQKIDLHFPKLSKPATHISLDGQDKLPNPERDTNSNNHNGDGEEEEDEDEDPMRLRVRELVGEFLHTTWTSAGHNISVNGIDVSSLPVPHTATLSKPAPEPLLTSAGISATDPAAAATTREELEGVDFQYGMFDAKLQHRVAALHGELEALTAQVSKLRRTAPGQGADMYRSRLRGAMDAEEDAYQTAMAGVEGQGGGDVMDGLEIDGVRDDWNDDVREVYERGVTELAELSGANRLSGSGSDVRTAGGGGGSSGETTTLTETVGKVQRAHRVAMEMEWNRHY